METNKYHVTLRSDINWSLRSLQILGWWPPEDHDSKLWKMIYVYYRTPLIIVLLGLIIQELVNIVMSFNGENLEKAVSATMIFFGHIMELAKLHAITRYYQKIIDLLQFLDNDEFQPKNNKDYEVLTTSMNNSIKLLVTYLILAVFAILGWSVAAIMQHDYKLATDAWYPYNIREPIIYEITFVYHDFAVFLSGACYISSDFLIAGLLAHIGTQLLILNNKANEIHEVGERSVKNLRKWINHHRAIAKLLNKFIEIFDTTLFFMIILSIFLSCVTTFLLSGVPIVSSAFLAIFIYQFCIMSSIYLFCWYGTQITYYSDQLSTSLYNSEWIEKKDEDKKAMLFTMLNAQRIQITPGGLMTLSTDSIIMIVKVSYSFFALLKNAQKN